MSWNQRTKVVALGIAIQAVAGTFVQPVAATDLAAASAITNTVAGITVADPTATGAIFDAPDVYLGTTGTAGGTIPLRGFGANVPAANAYVPGRVLQADGWTENVVAAAVTNTAQAGPNANAIKLAAAESAIANFWLGAAIQHPGISATPGTRQYGQIIAYDGVGKNALLALPVGTTITSGNYTIPAQLYYTLGTMTTPPPLLSISVWRDKKRYDYVDCRPTNLVIDVPVANEANTAFPTMQFECKGNLQAIADDTTPLLSAAFLAIPPAAARAGAFYLDRTMLGHQDLKFTQGGTVGAASDQNKDAGQDGYDILGGTRQFDLDLNQMNETDFQYQTRVNAQTVLPVTSVWGTQVGNRWALSVPNIVLRPVSPGDRGGYVSLTGTAQTVDVDKSVALAIF